MSRIDLWIIGRKASLELGQRDWRFPIPIAFMLTPIKSKGLYSGNRIGDEQ